MTVDELIVFLAHALPVGDAAGDGTTFGSAGEYDAPAEPPDEEDGGEAESEAADGKEDPMLCHLLQISTVVGGCWERLRESGWYQRGNSPRK